MLDVADSASFRKLVRALVNNISAHEIKGQSTDEDQYDVRIRVHYPDEILKIGKQYGESKEGECVSGKDHEPAMYLPQGRTGDCLAMCSHNRVSHTYEEAPRLRPILSCPVASSASSRPLRPRP
jgi:hypothetical protein